MEYELNYDTVENCERMVGETARTKFITSALIPKINNNHKNNKNNSVLDNFRILDAKCFCLFFSLLPVLFLFFLPLPSSHS